MESRVQTLVNARMVQRFWWVARMGTGCEGSGRGEAWSSPCCMKFLGEVPPPPALPSLPNTAHPTHARTFPYAPMPTQHPSTQVLATEPVMRKLAGLESAEGVDAAAELELPPPADFLQWPRVQSKEGGLGNRGGEASTSSNGNGSCSSSSSSNGGTRGGVGLESDSGPGRGGEAAGASRSSSTGGGGRSSPSSSYSAGLGLEQQGVKPGRSRGSSPGTRHRGHHQLRRLLALDGVQDPGEATTTRCCLPDPHQMLSQCPLLRGCSPEHSRASKAAQPGLVPALGPEM